MPREEYSTGRFRAQRFVEKPALPVARDYLAAGHYVWNSGMFAFTRRAIVDAFARHAPGVLAAVRPVAQALADGESPQMLEIDAALFAAVPDISLDYAVMEPRPKRRSHRRAGRVRLERRRLVAGGCRADGG